MKTVLLVISLLFSVSLYSQKVTLLYVNSSWNKSNDYKHLSKLKNVRVLKVNYDDQPKKFNEQVKSCLLYTSPSPRDRTRSRMPSSA